MADSKITGLTAITSLDSADVFEVVDVSANLNKQITQGNLFSGFYKAGGTDVAVADGGTGASSASGARTNLGLVIGTNVQAWDADLDAMAAGGFSTWVPWTAYTPTFTGWNGDPINGVYRYQQVGKMVTIAIRQPTDGTSNTANNKTISLPQAGGPGTAATITNMQWSAPAQARNNGTAVVAPSIGAVVSAGTAISFSAGWQGLNDWTASGGCRIQSCTITYEAA